MGVDARAIAMFGVYFNSKKDVDAFLEKYEIEEVEDMNSSVELECLNCYSGDPFILGYHVDIGETLDKYKAQWEKDFPNSGKTPRSYLEVVWY